MERRKFLHNLGHVSALASAFPSMAFDSLDFSSNSDLSNTASKGNIIVLIKLSGGNDGLNSLIPLDQYSNLTKARPHVLLPESKIVKLGKQDLGLHPSLSDFKSFFSENRLKIVQNVGYDSQDFSHFRSMDIWQSASDYDQYVNSGWIARFIENQHPNYPENYPNEQFPHPLSVELGWQSSLLFTGKNSFTSFIANNPSEFRKIINEFDNQYPSNNKGERLKYIQLIAKQSNLYSKEVKAAFESSKTIHNYPNSNLGRQLEIVSRLIDGGLNTRIYMVELGGFDTHDSQVDSSDKTKGEHSFLLKTLSDSITSFIKNLDSMGRSDDVLTLTFSEFGRTIVSNGSNGTDHGTAAPMFIFGNKVDPRITGSNPIIPDNAQWEDNLSVEFDYRQVYNSLINQWMGGNQEIANEVLFRDFDEISIAGDQFVDSDKDGVSDINDNCPDTPEGSIVDLTGCVIFSLPASNYTLKTVSNTCIGSNNGILSVSVENKEYDYNLEIPELEATYTLDSSNEHSLEISDLSIGLYTLKFTISDKEGYLQMFESQIGEPLPLEANANIDVAGKTASLVLGGSEKYYVEINGDRKVVTDKYYYLPLKAGMNTIKVSTPLECQGVYEKEVFISEEVTYYPNPVNDVLNIMVPGSDRKVIVQVYSDSGASVIREELSIGFTRTVQLRTNRLTSGVYIVNVTGKTVLEKFKVIKK